MDSFEVRDTRNQPFIWIDRIIFDQYLEHLGVIGLAIYYVLLSYTNAQNPAKSWPSYNTIAAKLKIGRSTVIKEMQKLTKFKLIGIEKQQTQKDGHVSNIYHILSVKPFEEVIREIQQTPSPHKTPGSIQEKETPSPSSDTRLVHTIDQPSPPERPYLRSEHEIDINRDKEVDISHLLNVSSSTHKLNLVSKEKQTQEPLPEIPSKKTTAPKTKPVSDSRAAHPAIIVVQEILGRFPNKLLWDEIIELLGETPDLEKLRLCAREWAKKTSNMGNMVWLFEWYKSGIPLSVHAANQIQKNQQNQNNQGEKPIRGKAAFDIAAKRFLERKALEREAKQNGQHL